MNPWPIIIQPQDDEILSSWLIRAAISNGSDPSHITNYLWPHWRPWTIDIDRSIPNDKLIRLSLSSGIAISFLQDMTLEPSIEQLLQETNLNPKKAWTWVIPTGNRNRTRINGLHFCPDCLAEPTAYYKKSWRLAWNVGCDKHNVMLINSCPRCNTTVSPHLVTYNKPELSLCVHCNYDLTDTPRTTIDSDALWLQNQLNKSFKNGSAINSPLDQTCLELFAITHFFASFILSSMKQLIPFDVLHDFLDISSLTLREKPNLGVTFEARSVNERHNIFIAVSKLLKLSTNDLIKLFQDCGITQQMLMASDSSPSLIQAIHKSLIDNKKHNYTANPTKRAFKPRTKEEVDAMMAKIKKFL